jgi:predicted DNA-binding antitoxin AbrB/MazE fold protein
MGVSLLKNLKKVKMDGEKVKIVSLLEESMG